MDESHGPAAGGPHPDDAARDYIAERVKAGASRDAIVQELIQRGYEPASARAMVGGVAQKHALSARKSGLIYLIAGVIITVLALVASIASYSAAAEQGGTYYVCCGLVLFGLALTVRGILQLARGREVK
jgi:predicted phage tail protein